MTTVSIESVGQIQSAEVKTGDLTVLLGPQATGKSIFFQIFKLTQDGIAIKQHIKKYGFDWKHDWTNFLSLYLGEGMENLWSTNSRVAIDGEVVTFDKILYAKRKSPPESVFLIPAQRVIILKNGWPRPFMDYASTDPFCLRSFSEHVRQLMEAGLGSGGSAVFPQEKRLKQVLRESLDTSIFNGAKVKLDLDGFQKRLVLEVGKATRLPYMAWSAGQREFMPLLLGMYWLMPPTKTPRKRYVQWVIVEEPEMGLHPQATLSFMLLVLELLYRGYRVMLSTHSPTVLDIVWAIRELQASKADANALRELFSFSNWSPGMKEMFQTVLRDKTFHTYFFSKDKSGKRVTAKDISSLDPGSDSADIAGWGGLSGYSGHIADVIAKQGAH